MKNTTIPLTTFSLIIHLTLIGQTDKASQQIDPSIEKEYTVDAIQRDAEPAYTCSMPDPDKETRIGMRKILAEYYDEGMQLKNRRSSPTIINVTAHRLMRAPCLIPDPTNAEVYADFDYTNTWFAEIGFNVYLNVTINNICNNALDDLSYASDEHDNWWELYNAYGVDGHLNVFYTSSGSSSTLPWDAEDAEKPSNMFVHKKTDGGWGWTVAHEIGHWFGLYHTFQGSGTENVTRDPNALGFNCETYGDELCSTPADYGTDWCDEPEDDCECTDSGDVDDCGNAQGTTGGSHTDAYGVPYDPDFLNIMAYGCRPCAHTWTGEQVDRQWVYLAYRLKQDNITHGSCMGNVPAGTLDPTQTTGTRIEAIDFIQSTQNIETNQYVLYDAANNVFLLPGFTAEKTNGVQPDFEIVNEGCYGEYQLTTPQSTVFRAKHAHEEKEVSGEGGQR